MPEPCDGLADVFSSRTLQGCFVHDESPAACNASRWRTRRCTHSRGMCRHGTESCVYATTAQNASKCSLRVFVHALPLRTGCVDQAVAEKDPSSSSIFGEPVFGRPTTSFPSVEHFIHQTDNYALASLFHWRLHHSPCRTFDPSEADVFYVPVLTRIKRAIEAGEACSRCEASQLNAALEPHLTAANAARHVLVATAEHPMYSRCDGWWSRPRGLFANMSRIAFSAVMPNTTSLRADLRYMSGGYTDHYFDGGVYPHTFSAPEPSNVHFSAHYRVPTTAAQCDAYIAAANRTTLMAFIGNALGNHGDVAVRQRLKDVCEGYGNRSVCEYQRFTSYEQLTLKRRSVFCLEPAGDTPFRRSLSDSIALGCIPVLFNLATELTAPLLWEGWREDSRVLVSRAAFLRGEVDLAALLGGVPPARVRHMQHTLARHGRRFTISTDDDPSDGLAGLLHGILRARGLY